MDKYCVICGKQLTGLQTKYCCKDCYKKSRLKQYKVYNKVKPIRKEVNCKICGKRFMQKNPHQLFCCKECREAYNKIYMHNRFLKRHVKVKTICPICGKGFVQSKYYHGYCSDECKNIAKQNKVKIKSPEFNERQCVICGKIFLSKSRTVKTCSDVCHKKYRVKVVMESFNRRQKEKDIIKEQQEKQEEQLLHEKEIESQRKEYEKFRLQLNELNSFENKQLKLCVYEIGNLYWNNNKWKVIINDFILNINYDSYIHSDFLFDNKEDAIKILYQVLNGKMNYIDDYIKTEYGISKPERQNVDYKFYKERIKNIIKLKKKCVIPSYIKDVIKKYEKNNNHNDALNYTIAYYNKNLIGYPYEIDKNEISAILCKNDYIGLEQYFIKKVLYGLEN